MYETLRFACWLGKYLGQAIGTTPVQISGTGATIFTPSLERSILVVSNPYNSTQTLFVGIDNTVASSGANSIMTIAPGQEKTLLANGSVVLWAVAAGASGGLISVVEGQ